MRNTNFKKLLLAGTAIVAVGGFAASAHAADQSLGAVGADTAVTPGAANTIVDLSADTDTGEFDTSGGVTWGADGVKAIDFDANSGTVYVFDGTDGGGDDTPEDTATFDGDVSIVSGKTLTFVLGDDEDSSAGDVGVTLDFSDATNTNIFMAGADSSTRGGNVVFQSVNSTDFVQGGNTVTFDGSMLLTTLSFLGSDGGTEVGSALTATLGNASADTIDVTGLVVDGGNATTTVNGGATNVTVTGTLTVGSGGVDIDGGNAATTGNGGNAKVTVSEAVTSYSGATTIDGGDAGSASGGAGGTAELELTSNFSGTGNFTVTGGAGGTGTSDDAGGTATLDADGTFTTTGTLTFAGGTAGTGSGNNADGGAAVGTFASTLNVAGLTLTGATGGSGGTNDGGAATVTVTGAGTVGSSGISLTAGNGGTLAGAALGGAATLTFSDTATLTGDVTVTGGTGADNDAADGGAATLTFTGAVTGTSQTLTINGGEGDDDTDGDGGAAGVEFNAGATFSSIVLNDGADNNATGGAATLTVDHAATATVTGTITAGADGEGAIVVENTGGGGTTTFASKVGTSSVRIGTLTLGNGNDGATVSFSNEVHADAITVSGADDDSTATFTDDVSVGATVSITDGGGANTSAAVFKGNLTGGAVSFEDSAGTAQATFSGSSAQTVTSTFAGSSDDEGDIIIGDGTTATDVTFSGNIGDLDGATLNSISTITVDGAATATFDGEVELGDALVVGDAGAAATAYFNDGFSIGGTTDFDGTITLGDESATQANTFTGLVTAGANQATTITVSSHTDVEGGFTVGAQGVTLLIGKTATFDPTDADGDGTANQATDVVLDADGQAFDRSSGGTLTIGIASSSLEFDDGDTIVLIDDDGTGDFATGLGDDSIVLQDSGLIDLQDNSSDADELKVKIVFKDATTVLGNVQGATSANALMNISSTNATGILGTARGNLLSASASAVGEIAESLSPTVNAGGVVAGTGVSSQVTSVTSARLAALKSGVAETGMVAGNVAQGLKLWGQAFGTTGQQDARDGVDGYDVDTLGFAAGVDTETLLDDWVWGLSFAYADTEVDGDDANDTQTDVSTYQLAVYAQTDLDDRTYVNAQLGYAWGDNESTRYGVGGTSANARADFDSSTYTANLEVGRNYAQDTAVVTPKLLLNYMHYDADSYTETGAGTANLFVDSEAMDLFEVGLGVDATWTMQNANGSYVQPSVHAGVRHDLIGDKFETTSNYTGGGSSFEADGFDPAQTTFNVGANVVYFSTSNWDFAAGYDYEFKEDFDSHSGLVKASYKF